MSRTTKTNHVLIPPPANLGERTFHHIHSHVGIVHTHAHAHTHTRTHARTYARTHARTHTHTHTHTHSYLRALRLEKRLPKGERFCTAGGPVSNDSACAKRPGSSDELVSHNVSPGIMVLSCFVSFLVVVLFLFFCCCFFFFFFLCVCVLFCFVFVCFLLPSRGVLLNMLFLFLFTMFSFSG